MHVIIWDAYILSVYEIIKSYKMTYEQAERGLEQCDLNSSSLAVKYSRFVMSAGADPELGKGVHFVEKVEDQKKKKRRSRMGERSSNITMKLQLNINIVFLRSPYHHP